MVNGYESRDGAEFLIQAQFLAVGVFQLMILINSV